MKPDILHSLTWQELHDGDFPPPRYLVHPLITEEGGALWVARWGTGKTWLGLEAGRCVAAGTPFLGHFPTIQGKVLYLDQEGTAAGIKDRLVKLENGSPLGTGLPFRYVCVMGLHLTDQEGFLFLDELLAAEQPTLVILDSWIRFFKGNENDAVAVANFNASLRSLRLVHHFASLPLDHFRKSMAGGQTDTDYDITRGSGDKFGAVDNGLIIRKSPDDARKLLLVPQKTRWSADEPAFRVRFDSDPSRNEVRLVYDGPDTTGPPGNDEQQPGRRFKVAVAVREIAAQAGPESATAATIQLYLEWTEATTRRTITAMLKDGQLWRRSRPGDGGKGRPPDFFVLPRDPADKSDDNGDNRQENQNGVDPEMPRLFSVIDPTPGDPDDGK